MIYNYTNILLGELFLYPANIIFNSEFVL